MNPALLMSGTLRELRYSEKEDDARAKAAPHVCTQGLRTTGILTQLFAPLTPNAAALGCRFARLGRALRALFKSTLRGAVLTCLALTTAMLWALYYMPLEKRIGVDGPSVLVEAANGQPLGRVGPLSDAVKRRDFPDLLVKAVLSIEDRRFYSHWGIDPWGIARATQANWAAGGIAEGGSTITQQLVKKQIVGNERNLGRKVR